MANPKLIVEIAADSRALQRTLKQTETQTQVWARKISTVTGSSTLGAIGTSKGFLAGALGAAGIAALKSTVSAAANAQQVLGQTRVALEDAGLSWQRYGNIIEKVVSSQSSLGFDDEEQLKAISTFARATGDVSKALDLTALSADVARGRYIDLASASTIVLKAQLGQAGALRRIGIDAKNGSSSIELLTLLTKKYGGAAEAAMGDATTANERLKVSLQNVQETVGSGALPVVGALARAMSDAADSASILAGKVKDLGVSFDFPTKSGKLLGHSLTDFVTFYPILKDVLGGTTDEVDKLGTSLNTASSAAQGLKVALTGISGNTFGVTPLDPLLGKKPAKPKTGTTAEQRNTFFDNDVSRSIDRAQDGSLNQQVAKLRKIEATLKERLAVTKDITRRLNLEDEIVSVQRQRRSIEKQIADNARQRTADAISAAAALKEQREAREKALDELRKQAQQAKQFRALGLAADGSDIVPGAANLRKQLGTLTKRLGSSNVNLSSKLESQLDGVRKVLAGKFGTVTKESREKIQGLFETIRSEFDKGGKSGAGPLTKTHGLDTKKILAGLGLSPADEAELRSRLSNVNSAGRLAGAGSSSRTGAQIIQSHVTVLLDGKQVAAAVTRAQQKAKKRNPAQRRGPNRGK